MYKFELENLETNEKIKYKTIKQISDDLNIDYCIGVANEGSSDITEEGKQACLKCLNYLKTLSEDERYSAMALADNFIN